MGETAKEAAGLAAVGLVEDGMRLGLGTGSTVTHFLHGLAGRGLDVAGVPTSEQTAGLCRELGIGLLDPGEAGRLDLAVDGADELDAELTCTKGGGGALLREKVVAAMAERFVVIATADKVVERLADTFPLPVEVVPFAVGPVSAQLSELGFEVVERRGQDGAYRTDNGNAVLDCRHPGGLEDPAITDVHVGLIPGVCGTGLFVDMAELALLGHDDGRVDRVRPRSAAD